MVAKDELPVQNAISVQPTLGRALDPKIAVLTDNAFLSGQLVRREMPDRYELNLKLSKDAPVGPIQGTVWLAASTVTNHHFAIPVGGKVIGNLRADPETIYFGVVPYGNAQTQEGRIVSGNGKGHFEKHFEIVILPISMRPHIGARMTDNSRFQLTLTNNAPAGRLTATARISCPQDSSAVVDVPVLGFVSTNAAAVSREAKSADVP